MPQIAPTACFVFIEAEVDKRSKLYKAIQSKGTVTEFAVQDEATLKRVYYYPEKSKLILTPENPKYEPLVFMGPELDEIHILGKAVAFQSEIK